jgi:hypothetical protein
VFCAVVAAVFGATFSTWRSLAAGLAPDPGYALVGRYLRLIRS